MSKVLIDADTLKELRAISNKLFSASEEKLKDARLLEDLSSSVSELEYALKDVKLDIGRAKKLLAKKGKKS